MRLRRETGDFQIKINYTLALEGEGITFTFNKIKPGLDIEDLVGELVLFHGTLESVNSDTDEVEAEDGYTICPISAASASSSRPSLLFLEFAGTQSVPINSIVYNKETGDLLNTSTQESATPPGFIDFTPVGPATPADQPIT